jgi:hypothetical protein
MFAGQRKGSVAMIERHILPACRMMTRSAVRAELPLMRIIVLVAGEAIGWRAFEKQILMATGTSHRGVPARQLEDRTVMIEVCRLPPIRGVA